MSKSVATAFQSLHRSLIQETRIATLGLYRLLLRSSESYPHCNILKNSFREKFKSNKNTTSRSKVLSLLEEAEKMRLLLEKGSFGDQSIKKEVNAYINQYKKKAEKRIETPKEKPKKAKPLTKRKPYQVAITAYHSLGYEFKRIRGWRQPVKTAMMLKNRVKTTQKRLERYQRYTSELEMIKSERMFLENLGCLPNDGLKGFEYHIKRAINDHFEIYNNGQQQREKSNGDKKP